MFEGLEGTSGLTTQKLMDVLREKIASAEVEYAVEDALVDAGYKGMVIGQRLLGNCVSLCHVFKAGQLII